MSSVLYVKYSTIFSKYSTFVSTYVAIYTTVFPDRHMIAKSFDMLIETYTTNEEIRIIMCAIIRHLKNTRLELQINSLGIL